MIEIRLTFGSAAEAADALARMAGVIAPADRPDAGGPTQLPLPLAPAAPVPAAPAAPSAASVFGGAAAAPSVPVPPPAPSTAAVAPLPTAPAATATSPTPPTANVPPAPPTASAAPVPSAPAAPTNPAGVEVDSEGIPWDGRIHGSTRAKNTDGTWRQKRGLNDPALKKRIEAELRAAMAAGTVVPPASPAIPPAAAVPPAPPVPAPPAAPAPVAAPPVPQVDTFPTLIARLTPHMRPDRLTDAHIAQVLASLGQTPPITGIAQLAVRPDLVPAAGAAFDAVLASLPGA